MNGVPQTELAIAPTIASIYFIDMRDTRSLKLGYADEWWLRTPASVKPLKNSTDLRPRKTIFASGGGTFDWEP